MNVCGINPNKPNTLSQSLTLFALLNMIEKVSLEDIPENELKKAKEQAMEVAAIAETEKGVKEEEKKSVNGEQPTDDKGNNSTVIEISPKTESKN